MISKQFSLMLVLQQWHTCDILCTPSLYHPRECFGTFLNLFSDLTASIFFHLLENLSQERIKKQPKKQKKNQKPKTLNDLQESTVSHIGHSAKWIDLVWKHARGERGEAKEAKMRLCSPTPVWPERSAKVRNDTKSNLMMIGEEPSRKEGKEETPCGRLQRWRTCRAALL